MDKINKVTEAVKKAAEGFKKTIKKIANMLKFLMTPIGHVIGILVLVVALILIIAVVLKVISNAFASWFDPNYAGISTDADYEYLVSSIGYAGYDSLISEKNWQEYLAYEYSVLIDVAEYIKVGQDEGATEGVKKRPDDPNSATIYHQRHLPYLGTSHDYDLSHITFDKWQYAVIVGQNSERFGLQDPAAVGAGDSKYNSVGGGTNCVPPTISYEIKDSPYDSNTRSLIPYITIVKQAVTYNYFTTGGQREDYFEKGKYGKNGHNDGVLIDDGNIGDIMLFELNNQLNVNNIFISTHNAKNLQSQSTINTSNTATWITADRGRVQNLYSSTSSSDKVYKIPLQVLVDRYLPKANLLTSWYMLKDTDYASNGEESATEVKLANSDNVFKVDELMADIKNIYNVACWDKETIEEEEVETVTYDNNGNILRDEEGNAIMAIESKPYATTHEQTFVYFGQVGLETNRYGVFKSYSVGGDVPGPRAGKNITTSGRDDETVIPIVTDLLSKDAYFVERLGFLVEYSYVDDEGNLITKYGSADYDRSSLRDALDSDAGVSSSPLVELSYQTLKNPINIAEGEMKDEDYVKEGSKPAMESAEHQFANYLYEFPNKTKVVDSSTIIAKPLEAEQINQAYYVQDIPFYYFFTEDDNVLKSRQDTFSADILAAAQRDIQDSDSPFRAAVRKYLGIPYYAQVSITGYTLKPDYRSISTYTGQYTSPKNGEIKAQNAVYTFEEQTMVLTIAIPQIRCSAMLVTEGETWAKSMSYSNKIVQNSFEPDNYRYVIPHSWFNFGLRVFSIDEHATYRTKYYEKYFSDANKESENPSAIKEADIMSMFLKWEEYGEKGVDTAYCFIRDLYKLVMYMRDEREIHENAYSYMYVPEDIWGFREGVTQESYWTEMLASLMGGADGLKQDEIESMRVKKTIIKWQQLDYDKYEECLNPDGTAKVYALFPHGNEFTRAYNMEKALYTGTFPDGYYNEGHDGADWYSRIYMPAILDLKTANIALGEGDEEIFPAIYESELKRRTIKKILESPDYNEEKKKSQTSAFFEQFEKSDDSLASSTPYASAKEELDAQLKEYAVRSPIVSVATGIVTKSYFNCYGGFAVHVLVSSGDEIPKIRTTFAHMRRWPEVQTGDIVGPGTIVGYEGTTGNSGGLHLHMGIVIDRVWQSPSRYMAPIFSPFYNEEKVGELLKQEPFASDNRLLLGTDYFSLIRTVILPRFNGNKLDTVVRDENSGVYLSSAVFVEIDADPSKNIEGGTYIMFSDSHDAIYNTVDSSHIIVKVGVNDPKYYKCEVKEVKLDSNSIKDSNIYDENGNTIYSYGKEKVMFKVLSKKETKLADSVNFKKVKVNSSVSQKKITWEDTKEDVKWGNNVPFSPLLEDSNDGVDINLLTIPRVFPRLDMTKEQEEKDSSGKSESSTKGKTDDENAEEEEKEDEDYRLQEDDDYRLLDVLEGYFIRDSYGGDFNRNDKIPDVRAPSDFFGTRKELTSSKRIAVPKEIAPYLSDATNKQAIPFYDGPIAKTGNTLGAYDFYESNPDKYGLPGTITVDLKQLQLALKSMGFAPDDMNTDGVFDEATEEAIKSATELLESLHFVYGISEGKEGKLGTLSSDSFDTSWIQSWNSYVTYGTYETAKDAAKEIIKSVSTDSSVNYLFLTGVSKCESGVYPTRESIEFAAGLGKSASFAEPTSLSQIKAGDGELLDLKNIEVITSDGQKHKVDLIEYPDGQPRVVRRAQGIFQLLWSVGKSRLAQKGVEDLEHTVELTRTPIVNARLASEYLSENMQQILADKTSLKVAKPYSKIKEYMHSDPRAKAWQAAADVAGTSPESLFIYGMSAIMYNQGKGASSSYFEALKDVEFVGNKLISHGDTAYGLDVVNYIISGGEG